jgi:hypothetical protein
MLTTDQIERIKKHLNYPQVNDGLDQRYNQYQPLYIPINYNIDGIAVNLTIEQERNILDVLTKLDDLWEKMFCSVNILSAKKVGEIEVNENYYNILKNIYADLCEKMTSMIDHRLAFNNSNKTHNGRRC